MSEMLRMHQGSSDLSTKPKSKLELNPALNPQVSTH